MVSLLPREHGAYAQLTFPLLTGLALAWPSLAAITLGLAAVAFFLANEPVAVLLGTRGRRILDQAGGRARRRGALLLGAGAALGLAGVWLGGAAVWPELAWPLVAGLLLVPTVLLGKQKTLPGELLVVTAFATLVLPLSAASGVNPLRAAIAAVVWWVSFALGTLEVHAIKARIKPGAGDRWTLWGSPLAAAVAVAAALWLALGQAASFLGGRAGGALGDGSPVVDPAWAGEALRLLPPAAAGLLFPALTILVLSIRRVHPRHLKRVGWTLVGANTLTLVALLQG